jgi:hypothetical protein
LCILVNIIEEGSIGCFIFIVTARYGRFDGPSKFASRNATCRIFIEENGDCQDEEMSYLLQTPWAAAVSQLKAVCLWRAIEEHRGLERERARREFGRACASLRWRRGATLLRPVTERNKRLERRQRRMTLLCEYCGAPIQAQRRGPLKRFCSDAALQAAISDFYKFFAQAEKQRSRGGPVALIVKQKFGWSLVDGWIKRRSDVGIASAWRDLSEETKKGILSCARTAAIEGV